MSGAPEILIIGHVTRDELAGGAVRPGGAAFFAAQAAAVLGVRTAVVTAAPAGSPAIAALERLPGVELHVVQSEEPTVFRLTYAGARRELALVSVATAIGTADIPPAWTTCPIAYVAPVAGECDRPLLAALAGSFVGLGAQGWLRAPASGGQVEAAFLPAIADPPPSVRAAILSEDDHPEAGAIAAGLCERGVAVALTRGARGATLLDADQRIDIPASPANESDPTGAGDVFGLLFTLALARGAGLEPAGRLAAQAAARVVEGPGIGTFDSESAAHVRAQLSSLTSK